MTSETDAKYQKLLTAFEKVERGVPLSPELDQALLHGASLGGDRPKVLLEEEAPTRRR